MCDVCAYGNLSFLLYGFHCVPFIYECIPLLSLLPYIFLCDCVVFVLSSKNIDTHSARVSISSVA